MLNQIHPPSLLPTPSLLQGPKRLRQHIPLPGLHPLGPFRRARRDARQELGGAKDAAIAGGVLLRRQARQARDGQSQVRGAEQAVIAAGLGLGGLAHDVQDGAFELGEELGGQVVVA